MRRWLLLVGASLVVTAAAPPAAISQTSFIARSVRGYAASRSFTDTTFETPASSMVIP